MKSIWGQRCRTSVEGDPTENQTAAQGKGKGAATDSPSARKARPRGDPNAPAGTGNAARHHQRQSQQHRRARSRDRVQRALARVPGTLRDVPTKRNRSTAALPAVPSTWRNVYRAAALLWSRRLTAKAFRGYKKRIKSGDTCQSLQRSVSGCQLTSVDLLVNGRPYYRLLKNSSQHTRLWTSQANRITSTLSSDGVRFFCSSLAVKVDWTPTSSLEGGGGVSCLEDLTSLELWATSQSLKRRRKMFSMELPAEDGFKANGFMVPKERRAPLNKGGGSSGFRGAAASGGGSLRNRPFGSVKRMPWEDYLVLDDGEFRLYEVPEDAFLPRGATRRGANRDGGGLGDAPADDVDVRSSVVIGTGGRDGGRETTHLHDSRSPRAVLQRMMSPLPVA